MPRAIRDTPIAMPIGIAVAHAARNAENTRNIDQPLEVRTNNHKPSVAKRNGAVNYIPMAGAWERAAVRVARLRRCHS